MFISSYLKHLLLLFSTLLLSLSLSNCAWIKPYVPDDNSQEYLKSNESELPGKYYQVSISTPDINTYLSSAEYRVWIPEGIERVRGIIIKQHGCGADAANSGLDNANDLQWQAIAAKHQFALMGTKLITQSEKRSCGYWYTPAWASKDALFQALDSVAKQSKRLELNQVPWVLWGHSAGSVWSSAMLQEHPERTIAMVAIRSGGILFLGTNPSLIDTPVLFSLGENEDVMPKYTFELPQKIFRRYRKSGALWTLAIEPNTGHEIGNSSQLAIPYIDAVINARLAKNSNELLPIDRDGGWLADNAKHTIASLDEYKGNPQEASWLPNREIAQKWQEYVTTGKVSLNNKSQNFIY